MKHDKVRELPRQLDFIDIARKSTVDWATEANIQLFRIEFVVPLVVTDKKLEVWLFFDTDERVKKYMNDRTTEKVKSQFIKSLNDISYPPDYLAEVGFYIDSDENVKTNFEGNYLYRTM